MFLDGGYWFVSEDKIISLRFREEHFGYSRDGRKE